MFEVQSVMQRAELQRFHDHVAAETLRRGGTRSNLLRGAAAPRPVVINAGQSAGSSELDRLAVRGVPVRIRPRFLALEKGCRRCQPLGGREAFERRKPVLVIARAVVRLPAIGGSLQ